MEQRNKGKISSPHRGTPSNNESKEYSRLLRRRLGCRFVTRNVAALCRKKKRTNQGTAIGCIHHSTSQTIWHSDVSMTRDYLLIIFFYYCKSEVYCFFWILLDTQFCMSYNMTCRIKIPLLPLYPEVTCSGSCETRR